MTARGVASGKSRDVQPHQFFSLSCLLYSRIDATPPPEPDAFATDVQDYLTRLHRTLLDPTALEQERRYLTRSDVDMLGRLATSPKARLRYTLYRGESEALVASVGLFETTRPMPDKKGPRPARALDEARMGRASGYYHFAFLYSQYVQHSIRESIASVLERLSVGFDKYIKILSHMRGEPVDLAARLEAAELFRVERTVNDEMQREELHQKQDAFLDLYGEWRRTGASSLEAQLKALAEEIRLLDPSFPFESPVSE